MFWTIFNQWSMDRTACWFLERKDFPLWLTVRFSVLRFLVSKLLHFLYICLMICLKLTDFSSAEITARTG